MTLALRPEVAFDELSKALPANFVSKVVRDDETGCWLWQGYLLPSGYGLYHPSEGTRPQVHRYAYENLVGPIPDGLVLDHLCRIRNCVNPGHLEPVTMRENTLRSPVAPAAVNSRKTHCDHGHAFDEVNTRHSPDGRRICRECQRARGRAHDAKRRAARRNASPINRSTP